MVHENRSIANVSVFSAGYEIIVQTSWRILALAATRRTLPVSAEFSHRTRAASTLKGPRRMRERKHESRGIGVWKSVRDPDGSRSIVPQILVSSSFDSSVNHEETVFSGEAARRSDLLQVADSDQNVDHISIAFTSHKFYLHTLYISYQVSSIIFFLYQLYIYYTKLDNNFLLL